MNFEEKLDAKMKSNNIYLTQDQLYKFKLYYKLLVEYNKRYNLTAIIEEDDVIDKHFVDSLLGLKLINDTKVIDVGTGAGFPGLAIKIVDDIELTLVDSVKKKVDFLEIIVAQLGLKNVHCIHSRVEDLANNKEYREKFNFCFSRAVAPLNVLAEYCLPFCKIGGKMLAYKSKQLDEELVKAKFAIEKVGGAVSNVHQFALDDMDRKIVEIKKVSPTPNGYPRGKNQPRTNAL